jgi:hypothetical protein
MLSIIDVIASALAHFKPAAVLATVKDMPCGRPRNRAFLDRPSAVGVCDLWAGMKGWAPQGARTKGWRFWRPGRVVAPGYPLSSSRSHFILMAIVQFHFSRFNTP